jgi:hypothetical protein
MVFEHIRTTNPNAAPTWGISRINFKGGRFWIVVCLGRHTICVKFGEV